MMRLDCIGRAGNMRTPKWIQFDDNWWRWEHSHGWDAASDWITLPDDEPTVTRIFRRVCSVVRPLQCLQVSLFCSSFSSGSLPVSCVCSSHSALLFYPFLFWPFFSEHCKGATNTLSDSLEQCFQRWKRHLNSRIEIINWPHPFPLSRPRVDLKPCLWPVYWVSMIETFFVGKSNRSLESGLRLLGQVSWHRFSHSCKQLLTCSFSGWAFSWSWRTIPLHPWGH